MSSQSMHQPPAGIAPAMVNRDEEHLRLLGTYHLVAAAIAAIGIVLFSWLQVANAEGGKPFSQLAPFLLQGALFVVLYVMNGLALKSHRNRISCILMSAAECVPFAFSFPLATILGVSAIIVLQRDSVKALFAAHKQQ